MRVLAAALLLSVATAFAPSCRHFGVSSTSRLLSSVAEASTAQEASNVQTADKIRYVIVCRRAR